MPKVELPTITQPIVISAADQRLQHCADPESTRYALGGVYFNSRVAAATDGRILAAKFKSSDPHDCVIGFAKPKQSGKQTATIYHPFVGGLTTVDNKNAATPLEGTFPDWQCVVPSDRPKVRVSLDISYLMKLAQALNDDDGRLALTLEIIDEKSPVLVRNPGNHNGAGVCMPLTSDDPDKDETVQSVFRRLMDETAEPQTWADLAKPEPTAEQKDEALDSMVEQASEPTVEPEPITMADPSTEPSDAPEATPEPSATTKQDRRIKHDAIDWDQAADFYRAGWSFPRIAQSLGLPKSTVYGRLKSMGVIVGKVKPPTAEVARTEAEATPNTVQPYLEKPVNLGGDIMPRGEAIAIMQQEGHPQPCIDRWLQGQELAAVRLDSFLASMVVIC